MVKLQHASGHSSGSGQGQVTPNAHPPHHQASFCNGRGI